MAGEVNGNTSRSSNNRISRNITDLEPPDPDFKSPSFITHETEFVGRGDIVRSSTPNTLTKHRRSRSRSGSRVTPAVLSLSKEHFYQDLEEYVKEMSAARDTDITMNGSPEPDVWSQLQQKESDLLLAAELGKALLDKNEELKKDQERLTEEYSKKLEVSRCSHGHACLGRRRGILYRISLFCQLRARPRCLAESMKVQCSLLQPFKFIMHLL